MRIILTILCLLFFSETAFGQKTFKMDKKRHNFGTVEGWNNPTVVFEITNNSNTELLLLPTHTTESVKIELPKYAIPPKATRQIKITCYPPQAGAFNQPISIYTALDDKPIKLMITGNIKSFHPAAYAACPGGVKATTSKTTTYSCEVLVLDRRTGEKIENVQLSVKDGKGFSTKGKTERNGKSKMQIPSGKYSINLKHNNYRQTDRIVYLSEKENKVTIELDKIEESVVMKDSKEPEITKKSGRANYTIGGQPTTRPYETEKPNKPKPSPRKTVEQNTSTKSPKKPTKQSSTVQSSSKSNTQSTQTTKKTEPINSRRSQSTKQPAPKTPPPHYRNQPTRTKTKSDIPIGTPTLTIKVTDSDRELFLNEAEVRIIDAKGAGKTMKTRGRGTAITELQPGNYDIVVNKNGYQQKITNVDLSKTQEVEVPLSKYYEDEKYVEESTNNTSITKTTVRKKRTIKRTTTLENGETVVTYHEEYVEEDIDPREEYNIETNETTYSNSKYSKNSSSTTRLDGTSRSKYYNEEERVKTKSKPKYKPKSKSSGYTPSKYSNQNKEHDSTSTYTSKPKESNTPTRNTQSSQSQSIQKPIKDFESDGTLSRDKYGENNVVFLIDVSKSMDAPNKLPLLKQSMKRLTDVLRDIDKITVIVYSMQAEVVLPGITSDNKSRIYEALESLEAAGSTRGVRGIETAYQWIDQNYIYKGNNQIILATDGEFKNEEEKLKSIYALAKKNAQDKDIVLSVIGFGQNKDAERLMKKLAYWGQGKYINLVDVNSAREILVNEIKERSSIK